MAITFVGEWGLVDHQGEHFFFFRESLCNRKGVVSCVVFFRCCQPGVQLGAAVQCSALIDCSVEPSVLHHSSWYNTSRLLWPVGSRNLYFIGNWYFHCYTSIKIYVGLNKNFPRWRFSIFIVWWEWGRSDGATQSWWVSSVRSLLPRERAQHRYKSAHYSLRGSCNKVVRLLFSQYFILRIFPLSASESVLEWLKGVSQSPDSVGEEKGSERKISKETECVLFIRWPVSYALQANMIMHKSIFSHCGKKIQETQKVRS